MNKIQDSKKCGPTTCLNHYQQHNFGLGSKLTVWRILGNRITFFKIMAIAVNEDS